MDKAMKSLVELYTLGILSEDSRRVVELAYDTDAEVQAWFEELGELPDHVDIEFDSEAGKRMVVEVLKRHPGSRDAILGDIIAGTIEPDFEEESEDELAEVSEESVRAILEVIRRAYAGEHSSELVVLLRMHLPMNSQFARSDHYEFTSRMAGATDATHSIVPELNYGLFDDSRSVFIRVPVESLPHGLCVLTITEPILGAVYFHVPALEKDSEGKNWIFTSKLYDLLGHSPESDCCIENFLPANTSNMEWFLSDMIKEQVDQLPEEQRELAEEFLRRKKPKDGK